MNCILSIYSSLRVYLLFRQCVCYDLTMNLLEVLKSQNTSRRVRKCNYIFMQMFYQMTYAAKAVRLQRQVFLVEVGRSIKCWGTSSCNIRTRIDGKVSPPTWNSVIHERSWKYSGIVHCKSRDNIMSVRSRFWLLGSRVIQLADSIKREFTEADDRKSLTRSVPRTLVEYMRILSRHPYLYFMRSNWIIKSSRTLHMASIIYYSHRSIDDLSEISIRGSNSIRINGAHHENYLDVNATFPHDEWRSISKNRRPQRDHMFGFRCQMQSICKQVQ